MLSGRYRENHNLCRVCRHRRKQIEAITVDLVTAIHTRVMAEERGDCLLISEANLHHPVFRANLIPDCVPRAAFIFYSLCAYIAFHEGNERTAHELSAQILGKGGYDIDAADQMQLERLSEGIVAFTTDLPDVGTWLADQARKRGW